MADITINGITIDPTATQAAGLAALAPGAAPAIAAALPVADTRYVLVQVDRPLRAADRSALDAAGAKILEYAPENAYVCRFEPADLAPVRQLPFVTWAGPYLRGFKVAPSLAPFASARMSLASAVSGLPTTQDALPKTVDVIFHHDVDPKAATTEVAHAAGLDPSDVVSERGKVRLTVQSNRLAALAALDDVRTIEPVFPVKLHNDVARKLLGIDTTSPGPLPFEGRGQIIAVADTGFDKGSTTNVHPAFSQRVLKLYALGRPNKSNDPHGHGTHVAGSALGDGHSAIMNKDVRGTAPKARLVLQSVLGASGGLTGLPHDLRALFRTPYEDGARVHTNSWGSTLGDSRYDSQAFEVDDFVWSHRDCVICFAAGNEGVDADRDGIVDRASITPPGTAKNCITVGASENHRPGFSLTYGSGWPASFPSNPLFSDKLANNPTGMVAFSSRGPTADMRFKPDVVAPGTFVISARSRDTQNKGWGLAPDAAYMYEGGTSMATPLVAGCCAIVREYLVEQRAIARPSAALVKAMLINGAQDLPGQYVPSEAGPTPNFAEGFGRIDMQATIDHGVEQIVALEDEGRELDTGDEFQLNVQVPAGAHALKATLVWTDPPGAALQNDLDLIVRLSGQERHGNVPPNTATFDRVNNVEQVSWTNPAAGEATVVVRAFRVSNLLQSFALVVRVH